MPVRILNQLQCECGSILVQREDGLHHDQYAREASAPFKLIESRPLECKWVGAHFATPTMELQLVKL